jgi:hypothetical protein
MATTQKNTQTPVSGPVQAPPPEEESRPVEMKMQPHEFAELRDEAARIGLQDAHLGRFLAHLLHHLGHAHGLDAATEDAKAAEANAAPKDEEDEE